MGYIPERGDIVWIDFEPTLGHEQRGHRPALVLSPKVYNQAVGLMLCCPMTSKKKGYPFEVEINKDSVVLSDQVTCLDWQARKIKLKSQATAEQVQQVSAKLKALV